MYKEIISKLEENIQLRKEKSGAIQILSSSKGSFIKLGKIVFQSTISF